MQNRLLQIVSWGGTLLALSYFGWTYWHLMHVTKIFGDMFSSMGIELPALTLFVISSRGWLYPMLFLGLGALVVIKELLIRDKKLSLALTSFIAFSVLLIANSIVSALYTPLFTIIEKLNR